MKHSVLLRRSPLRSRHRRRKMTAAEKEARMVWRVPHQGFCKCGCGRFTTHLERHHVVYEQHVRAENGDAWDLANSLLLHPVCHSHHHSGLRRIRIEYVPAAALAFALDLLGEHRSAIYLNRYYDCTVTA